MNLRMDCALTRGLGAELHVCEVQLLLRELARPLDVSARHTPARAARTHACARARTHARTFVVCPGWKKGF